MAAGRDRRASAIHTLANRGAIKRNLSGRLYSVPGWEDRNRRLEGDFEKVDLFSWKKVNDMRAPCDITKGLNCRKNKASCTELTVFSDLEIACCDVLSNSKIF